MITFLEIGFYDGLCPPNVYVNKQRGPTDDVYKSM